MSDDVTAQDGTAQEGGPDSDVPGRHLPELSWSVGAVAERLGLSASTLRSWERRYGLAPTHRTHGGHRRYGPADVQRVQLMARLTSQGVPAQVAAESVSALTDAAVAARLASSDAFDAVFGAAPGLDREGARGTGRDTSDDVPEPSFAPEAIVEGIIGAALHLDSGTLVAFYRQALRQLEFRDAWSSVFAPALRLVGERWGDGSLGVEGEHLASELLQGELRSVVRANRKRVSGVPVLLGSADDEHHHLPVIAVEAELARCGAPSVFLGARVPARSMVDALVQTRARVMFLWASLPRPESEPFWRLVSDAGRPVTVVLGGPGWAEEPPEVGHGVDVRLVGDLEGAVDLLLEVNERGARA
ncbi:MerR family transcriptional regulator [Intrasporangium sp. YIM S08009]|uniref:MerR family transcriptional regulator n=1 Tax=Intrasporangium zincisolvens TaxID=3080018 RepID=UPI002B05C53A|nr:MerR family transcriptional regulator [Intrasporangium sp. YIM S08009]